MKRVDSGPSDELLDAIGDVDVVAPVARPEGQVIGGVLHGCPRCRLTARSSLAASRAATSWASASVGLKTVSTGMLEREGIRRGTPPGRVEDRVCGDLLAARERRERPELGLFYPRHGRARADRHPGSGRWQRSASTTSWSQKSSGSWRASTTVTFVPSVATWRRTRSPPRRPLRRRCRGCVANRPVGQARRQRREHRVDTGDRAGARKVRDRLDLPQLHGARRRGTDVGVDAAFGRNLRRLAEVKATNDPDNFFRRTNDVLPAF